MRYLARGIVLCLVLVLMLGAVIPAFAANEESQTVSAETSEAFRASEESLPEGQEHVGDTGDRGVGLWFGLLSLGIAGVLIVLNVFLMYKNRRR